MRKLLVVLFIPWAILSMGCEDSKPTSGSSPVLIYFSTHEHDGHRFVVVNAASGVSTMHHPDCLCGKR